MHPWSLSLPLSVSGGHDERLPASDCEFVHSPDDPPHGVVRQRPHGFQAVLFQDLRLALEDGGARQAPVNDLRRTPPGFQLAAPDLFAIPGSVGPLRPDDGPSITAGDQHEALPGGRRSKVCRHQLPVLHGVAQVPKLGNELPEGRARQLLHGLALAHRAPGLELLHILQHDDPGPHQRRPAEGYPGEAPDLPVDQRRPLGLGEVLAVRGKPCSGYRTAPTDLPWVDVPDTRLVVLGVGVVGLVHQDRSRVMVDGSRHRNAQAYLDPRGCPAASGEVVHEDLPVHVLLVHHLRPSILSMSRNTQLVAVPAPITTSAIV